MPDLIYLPIFAAESTKYKRNYSPGAVQPAGRIFDEKLAIFFRLRPKSIRFLERDWHGTCFEIPGVVSHTRAFFFSDSAVLSGSDVAVLLSAPSAR